MSLSRKSSSRSAYRPQEGSVARPRSSLGVRSDGVSEKASQDLKTQHKHNDYSCYIHVVNRTESSFQLVDSKSTSGHWAAGTPPQKIAPDTDTLIELTDPKGPHGSEGWCSYTLQHPERTTPITFKLKFSDPYWTGSDNYLKASTRHPGLVSLNVFDYQTSGHPFIAYVEVKTLRTKAASKPKRQHHADEVRSESSSDDGTRSLESPTESLPSYDSRPNTASGSTKEPTVNVQPIIVDVGHESPVEQNESPVLITVTTDEGSTSEHDDDDAVKGKTPEAVSPIEETKTLLQPHITHEAKETQSLDEVKEREKISGHEDDTFKLEEESEFSNQSLDQKITNDKSGDNSTAHDLEIEEREDKSTEHDEDTERNPLVSINETAEEANDGPNLKSDKQLKEKDEETTVQKPIQPQVPEQRQTHEPISVGESAQEPKPVKDASSEPTSLDDTARTPALVQDLVETPVTMPAAAELQHSALMPESVQEPVKKPTPVEEPASVQEPTPVEEPTLVEEPEIREGSAQEHAQVQEPAVPTPSLESVDRSSQDLESAQVPAEAYTSMEDLEAKPVQAPESAEESHLKPVHKSVEEPVSKPASIHKPVPEPVHDSRLLEESTQEPAALQEPMPALQSSSVQEPASAQDLSTASDSELTTQQAEQSAQKSPRELASVQHPDLEQAVIENADEAKKHNSYHENTEDTEEIIGKEHTKEHDNQVDNLTTMPRSLTVTPKPTYVNNHTQTDLGLHDFALLTTPKQVGDEDATATTIDEHQLKKSRAESSRPPAHHEAHVPGILQTAAAIWSDVTTAVFKTRHGQLGIIALVFLTSYGVTAAKVSRGIMVGGGRR